MLPRLLLARLLVLPPRPPFNKWKSWCTQFKDMYIALYLVNLVQSGLSYSTIQSAYYAISFFHKTSSLVDPCESIFLKFIIDGFKRLCTSKLRHRRQKLPILAEHLNLLVTRFASAEASLPDIRDVTFCLLAFAGFFRFNEICNMKWSHLTVHETHIELFYREVKLTNLARVPM